MGTVDEEFTITTMVALVLHWPALGVNVYVVVPAEEVLMVAGLQVPLIPLVEVLGKASGVLP